MKNLEEIIINLPPYAKITGSYARGEQHLDSDFDFYIPEIKWPMFRKWAHENIKVTPDSCIVGHLSWRTPTLIEFSDIFRKQKNVLKEVELFGRTFKCH